MASLSSEPVWQRLSDELKHYGDKIDAAKTQFDELNVSIDEFTRQLDAAAERERKITSMLESFMDRIDAVDTGTKPLTSSLATGYEDSLTPKSNATSPVGRMTETRDTPGSPSVLRASDLDAASPMKLSAGGTNVHISRRGSITISK